MLMIILETQRLLLRELEESDLDALAEIYGNAEVMRYIGNGVTFSREQTLGSIKRWREYQKQKGFSNWAVIEKASGLLTGKCGFNEIPGNDIEISYLFAKAHWGKGIATEISKAVLEYGFNVVGLERVVALAYPQNIASIKVIEKLGMQFEQEAEYWGIKLMKYSIDKPNN